MNRGVSKGELKGLAPWLNRGKIEIGF